MGRFAGPAGGRPARWREAERLLEDAADIEKDVARLAELREVLPRMQGIAEQRNEAHKAEEKVKELDEAEAKTRRGAGRGAPTPWTWPATGRPRRSG